MLLIVYYLRGTFDVDINWWLNQPLYLHPLNYTLNCNSYYMLYDNKFSLPQAIKVQSSCEVLQTTVPFK